MPKIQPTKTKMREQPPEERIHNNSEVPYGYSEEEAIHEAKRCLQCKKPLCVAGCPVEINIPGFIRYIAEGKFRDSIGMLKEKNVLPAVCGRVCPQEEQCEKLCVLGKKMEPVGIGRLERFAADWEAEQGESQLLPKDKSTGKRVAIVGSGPAGITVAGDLIQAGHEVRMFEALHEPGGVLVYGIPEFRLPKRIVAREVDFLCRMGVKLEKNFVVGTALTVDEILKDFDAVFLGTGAGLPWFMDIPGENLNNIYSANEYLTRANLMKAYLFPEYDTPIAMGKRVATIGGGNVAMDSARTALRLGADKSFIIYRRSRVEMPARNEEIHHAEEEGIVFNLLTNPVAYHGDENMIAFGSLSKAGGYEATTALLNTVTPDAIFYAADSMAYGGYQYFREHSIHIPDDIGIIGFDDVTKQYLDSRGAILLFGRPHQRGHPLLVSCVDVGPLVDDHLNPVRPLVHGVHQQGLAPFVSVVDVRPGRLEELYDLFCGRLHDSGLAVFVPEVRIGSSFQ